MTLSSELFQLSTSQSSDLLRQQEYIFDLHKKKNVLQPDKHKISFAEKQKVAKWQMKRKYNWNICCSSDILLSEQVTK